MWRNASIASRPLTRSGTGPLKRMATHGDTRKLRGTASAAAGEAAAAAAAAPLLLPLLLADIAGPLPLLLEGGRSKLLIAGPPEAARTTNVLAQPRF